MKFRKGQGGNPGGCPKIPTHPRKARRLLQAATLTTKDRAVALEQNATPRLKAIGGGKTDSWNRRIGQRLGEALPDSHLPNFVEAARASLDGLIGINPTDPIEGMIAGQIIAAHEAAMHLLQSRIYSLQRLKMKAD